MASINYPNISDNYGDSVLEITCVSYFFYNI
jgi:hypothetical protein